MTASGLTGTKSERGASSRTRLYRVPRPWFVRYARCAENFASEIRTSATEALVQVGWSSGDARHHAWAVRRFAMAFRVFYRRVLWH